MRFSNSSLVQSLPNAAKRLLLFMLVALAPAGCENAAVATPVPTTITIGGATAMRRVLQDLTAEFNRQHSDVLFVVRGGGSTVGEELVRRGEVNLGASTLLPPEQAVSGTPDTLVRIPIGLDGLAMVVHPSNNIEELSLVQARDIFEGRILDWLALGSDAGEIQLVSREDGSGSRILFDSRVMGDARVALTAIVMPTSRDVVEYVSKNPQAIGYVSRAEVAESVPESNEDGAGSAVSGTATAAAASSAATVKVLRLEGRYPTRASMRSQEYALTQPLYLLAAVEPTGRVRQFIDFVLSPAGQGIVARYHAPIR
jgi:phosphate transport system substrate-binding protein